MLRKLKKITKRVLKPGARMPVLGEQAYGGPDDSPITLAMVCREGFNINIPNASTTIRLGFCRGFAQIGVRYQLVNVFKLARVLPQLRRPFVFLTCYDYEDLDAQARKLLRNTPHFIWVPPWFENLEEVYARHNLPDPRLPETVNWRILDSGAAFVWAPVTPSCLAFYEEWQKRGQRLEAIPLACDTTRYYKEPDNRRYADVKMAFVGGYRAYKNVQYDKYLKPYEEILAVYGYDCWPYKGYGGLLPEGDERVLYQNARVCPALSEPHAEVMGDIVERVFKVVGSGGLTITDVIPFYRELFEPDELLVPSCIDEYHEMVKQALEDEELGHRYREKGYAAIKARHTYAHRAEQILGHLGIELPVRSSRGSH